MSRHSKHTFRLLSVVVFSLSALILSSCTGEYHYAKSYLGKFKYKKKSATEKIYVCLPQEVIHTNSSLDAIPGFANLSTDSQDSIIASLTQFLDKIDDSIFLDQFNNSLLYTLSRTRIPIVLVDNPDQLPSTSEEALTLYIPQLEAEEFIQRTRSDFYTQKGTYYAYDYDLRHFSTNAWFVFDNKDTSIFFKNVETQDEFHGTVTSIRNKKASVDGHFNRITINDAYETARNLGSWCAQLYVERIITQYVKSIKGTNRWYFLYNYYDNSLNVIIPYEDGMKDAFEKL